MERSWLDRVADDLAASRAELVGLAVLLVGGIVLTLVVVGRVPVVPASSGLPDGAAGAVPGDVGIDVGASSSPVVPSTAPSTTPEPVVVHVTGAVREPTVVTLPAGARSVDAIDAAGGAREDAALDVLNLAQVLGDGQRLHVPTVDEVAAAAEASSELATASAPATTWGPEPGVAPGSVDGSTTTDEPGGGTDDGLLDLNQATIDELEGLPGVGPVLAERIVAWRDDHGGFADIGQLRDVTGIGEATFQDLAPLVVVP